MIDILACATCSLDRADSGQVLLVVTMLAAPLVAIALGAWIVRTLLARQGERSAR